VFVRGGLRPPVHEPGGQLRCKQPTQLPTHRRTFGIYFEFLHENIRCIIKGLGRAACFGNRRSIACLKGGLIEVS
jgi:hypothetical protein